MMKIDHLILEDYGPIKSLNCKFSSKNVIIGYNGTGKTHIIELLAGLTGHENCAHLLSNREFGSVKLVVRINNDRVVFDAEGSFDPQAIADFRNKLDPFCSNFGQDENGSMSAMCGTCDMEEVSERLKLYIELMHCNIFESINPHGLAMPMGDGNLQAMRLILLSSMTGGPLLLDLPERHLDLVAKRRMYNELLTSKEQVILCTHTPEFLSRQEHIIDLS